MMMKNKVMTGLAIGAMVTASLGLTAMAEEEKREVYTVTVEDSAGMEIPAGEWNTGENGVRYYDTEEGVRISIVSAGHDGYEAAKPPRKVDENGNEYIEMEDGARVYVSRSKSVSVD